MSSGCSRPVRKPSIRPRTVTGYITIWSAEDISRCRNGPAYFAEISQRTIGRYQIEFGCVADRPWPRRGVPGVPFEDELDRRRHGTDVELCGGRGRNEFQGPR